MAEAALVVERETLSRVDAIREVVEALRDVARSGAEQIVALGRAVGALEDVTDELRITNAKLGVVVDGMRR